MAGRSSKKKILQIGTENTDGFRFGAFAKAMRVLADHSIGVEYMYAFISRDKGKAYVIIRTDKSARAAEVLTEKGVELLTADALYNM